MEGGFVIVNQLDKRSDAGRGARTQIVADFVASKSLPGTAPMFYARFQRSLDGRGADAAGGSVDDPKETGVVVRIRKHTHVGKDIFDFAPVEKALPAHDPI